MVLGWFKLKTIIVTGTSISTYIFRMIYKQIFIHLSATTNNMNSMMWLTPYITHMTFLTWTVLNGLWNQVPSDEFICYLCDKIFRIQRESRNSYFDNKYRQLI